MQGTDAVEVGQASNGDSFDQNPQDLFAAAIVDDLDNSFADGSASQSEEPQIEPPALDTPSGASGQEDTEPAAQVDTVGAPDACDPADDQDNGQSSESTENSLPDAEQVDDCPESAPAESTDDEDNCEALCPESAVDVIRADNTDIVIPADEQADPAPTDGKAENHDSADNEQIAPASEVEEVHEDSLAPAKKTPEKTAPAKAATPTPTKTASFAKSSTATRATQPSKAHRSTEAATAKAKRTYAGVGVTYDTHVQRIGWQKAVKNGAISGTSGKSLRLEALHIMLTGADGLNGAIKYSVHVQNIGWQDAVTNGKMAGTSGRSLRLEGLKIWLTGKLASHYDVLYRTHVQNVGWQGWVKNGSLAGTTGRSLRLEAVQIKLSPKTAEAAGKTGDKPRVRYEAHVQNDGWQMWVGDGSTAGTSGRSLRVEALNVRLDPGSSSGGIEYQAHVQNIGWQDWAKDGKMAGTSGRGLRVEAFRIRLTGDIAKTHDVYYRVHVQDVGWLDWAKDGAVAGTSNCHARMEAVQVIVQEKGKPAPGTTAKPSYSNRWDFLEAGYLDNSAVRELLEVKYTGGSSAQVALRQKQGGTWKTVLTARGYVGERGVGATREGLGRTPRAISASRALSASTETPAQR